MVSWWLKYVWSGYSMIWCVGTTISGSVVNYVVNIMINEHIGVTEWKNIYQRSFFIFIISCLMSVINFYNRFHLCSPTSGLEFKDFGATILEQGSFMNDKRKILTYCYCCHSLGRVLAVEFFRRFRPVRKRPDDWREHYVISSTLSIPSEEL